MAIEGVGSKVIKFYVPLAAYLIFLLFPFYWMVNTVFKSDTELYNLDLNPFYIHSYSFTNFTQYSQTFYRNNFPQMDGQYVFCRHYGHADLTGG
jgi:multiple sugar transport system permease protein